MKRQREQPPICDPCMLPLPTSGRPLAARRQAPTLLARHEAGEGDRVQVWAPTPWRWALWVTAREAFWLTRPLSTLAILSRLPGAWRLLLFPCLVLSLLESWARVSEYRRSRAIANDQEGIAFTTAKRSVTLLWSEIQRLEIHRGRWEIRATHCLPIELAGYAPGTRRLLLSQIVQRAGLKPSRYDPTVLVREAETRQHPIPPAAALSLPGAAAGQASSLLQHP